MTSKDPYKEHSWEAKLKPGAVQLLSLVCEGFEDAWDHYRQRLPPEGIQEANLVDLDWTSYYRDMQSDAGVLETFLDPNEFVEVAQASLREMANDRHEFFLTAQAFQHAVLFQLNGLEHPATLLKRIREGEDRALFDFAKVDKTIVQHPYVEKRIRLAQISGDSEFFRRLGNALRWDPRNRPFKVHKRNFLLKAIAHYATEHLTMKEVCAILEKICGIYEFDLETVRKAWTRAGLHQVIPQEKKREDSKG